MNEGETQSSLMDVVGADLNSLLSPSIATASKTALDRILTSDTGGHINYFNDYIGSGG